MDTSEPAMSYVAALSGPDLDYGKGLWQLLRNNEDFPIQGVLWLLEPEAGEYRLIITSSKVDSLGLRHAYRELAEVTRSIPAGFGQQFRIELMSPRHPVYQALRSVFAHTTAVEGTRLGNTMVGGTYIDDAYLYEVR
jgi:hypothetical protein